MGHFQQLIVCLRLISTQDTNKTKVAEGEEVDDDDEEDSKEGYVSPEDPFPREARRRPMEEDLDKDFDPNEEVGKKP